MSIKAETSFSLADQLFNADSVARLSKNLKAAHKGFKPKRFEKTVLEAFPVLELKARISCMVDALDDHLPASFNDSLAILEAALPEPLDPTLTDDDFGEFIWAVPSEYVAKHGCSEERLDRSLAFLRRATMSFTVESAIRPFLRDFPEETMSFVHDCASHDNYHVRRLASEGIRPYLPWALRVIIEPDRVVEVLSKLHADNTRYVTRSVANTMNDLSRDHPALVIDTLNGWRNEARQHEGELDWMTRHSLRTLVKTDNADALELLGYPAAPQFSLGKVSATEKVKVGESLKWRGTLTSKAAQKLKVALRVYFLKANGTHSTKVFAIKDVDLGKGEKFEIDKALSFKPITTRVLYAGTHHVELLVNGKARGKKSFQLVT